MAEDDPLSASPASADGRPEHAPWYRAGGVLVDLNERIARLGIALDVPLRSPADIEQLLARPPGTLVAADDPQRRYWHELWGLLVLRYAMYSHIAQSGQAESVRRLLAAVSARMVDEGFRVPADGVAARIPQHERRARTARVPSESH